MGKKITWSIPREMDVDDLRAMGAKGGKATAAKRSKRQRANAARHAVNARWKKYYEEHPEMWEKRRRPKGKKKA